jgi:hypothetical protein
MIGQVLAQKRALPGQRDAASCINRSEVIWLRVGSQLEGKTTRIRGGKEAVEQAG